MQKKQSTIILGVKSYSVKQSIFISVKLTSCILCGEKKKKENKMQAKLVNNTTEKKSKLKQTKLL